MFTTGASEATSQQQSTTGDSRVLVQKYDNAVDKVTETLWNLNHKSNCNLNRARKYISNKRKATWEWQDKILVPHTRTNYAERKAHGCKYIKWLGKRWATNAEGAFRTYVDLQDPEAAICHVFGNYCTQALAVTACESGHSRTPRATNGQYLGMFQMGSFARSTYGHGNTPLEQAIAAYKYFVASGRDWSPWSCKPY